MKLKPALYIALAMVLLAGAHFATFSPLCAQKPPVVDLQFEGERGGNAEDSSGHEHEVYFHTRDTDATAADFVSRVDGKHGKGIRLDGQGEVINKNGCMVINGMDQYDFSDGLTIEMWIKPEQIGENPLDKHELASDSTAGRGPGFRFTLTRNGDDDSPLDTLRFGSGDGESFWQAASKSRGEAAAVPIIAGEWYHVAGVYDGNRFHVFINGDKQGSSKEGLELTKGSGMFSIGSYNRAYRFGFNGVIDDVLVYDYARDEKLIKRSATSE